MTAADLGPDDLTVIDAALYAAMQAQIEQAARIVSDVETSPFPASPSDSALGIFAPPTIADTIAPIYAEYQRVGAVRAKLLGFGGPKSREGFDAETRKIADRLADAAA